MDEDTWADKVAEVIDERAQVTIKEQDIEEAERRGTSPAEEALRRQPNVLDVRASIDGLWVVFDDGTRTLVPKHLT